MIGIARGSNLTYNRRGLNAAGGTTESGKAKACDSVESGSAWDVRSGARGGKRDVCGLSMSQQLGGQSSSAGLPANGGPWGGYLPAKLQDLTQIGQNTGVLFATGLRGWL